MQKIVPCLWFKDHAEEAADFYTSLFKNSHTLFTTHYDSASAKVSGQPEGSVLTVDFELAGYRMTALNGGPIFSFTPAMSISVQCETEKEIDALFEALSDGGSILMPLQKYDFSPKYAWINDKYGLSWQLNLPEDYSEVKQKIDPFIMFTGDNFGKAQEAMEHYTSIFPNAKITSVFPGEADGKNIVQHATFEIMGEEIMAIDSAPVHAFGITPAVSLMVLCETQEEMDRFTNALSANPAAEQCGWLEDKYGVSWQIVPQRMDEMMQDTDPVRRKRVMKAMLDMKRLDLTALEAAYAG